MDQTRKRKTSVFKGFQRTKITQKLTKIYRKYGVEHQYKSGKVKIPN